jgi:hypothetical protein
MAEAKLVRDETPVEFFREQLAKAMEHQKIATSAFTEYYLVNLLAGCVSGDNLPAPEPGYDEQPLALLYVNALQASRVERARLLRAMGDTALFVSGFFASSLETKLADAQYYRAMGGHAYARLSALEPLPYGPSVFSELSQRFSDFADVFSEVSEASLLTTNHSVLRLYEKWQATGSRHAAMLLAERGITPVANPGGKLS